MPTYLVFPFRREKRSGELELDQPTKDVCDGLIEYILKCEHSKPCRIIAVAGYAKKDDQKSLAELIVQHLQPALKSCCQITVPTLTWTTLAELRAGLEYARQVNDKLVLVSRRSHLSPQIKLLAWYLQKHFPEVTVKTADFISADDDRSPTRVALDMLKSLIQLFLEEIGVGRPFFRLFREWHREPGKPRPA